MRYTAIVGFALLLSCASSSRSHPKELVGKWSASGNIGEGDRKMSWTKKYDLRPDGSFVMTGYPPIEVRGKWSVTKRSGNKFLIKLTSQEMRASRHEKWSTWADQENEAVMDGSKLSWQKETFHR